MKIFVFSVLIFSAAILATNAHSSNEKRFLGSVGNWINNNIVNPINNHVINPISENVINPISNLINGSGNGLGGNQDFCTLQCSSKVNISNNDVEFFFDRPNGCKSKGFLQNEFKSFDNCCDEHNVCLNSHCCTTDCENIKNECDKQYYTCLRSICFQLINNADQLSVCEARSNVLLKTAKDKKLCYCHLKP